MKDVISKLGENIQLRRCAMIQAPAPNGFLLNYQHNSVGPNMSQIAVLLSVSVDGDPTKVNKEQLHKIAMHVAAANPLYLSRNQVPADVVERERALVMDSVKKLNKPEKIVARMVEGKLGEFYRQCVLMDQLFILDEKQGTITKCLQKLSKDSGAKLEIDQFVRMQVGK